MKPTKVFLDIYWNVNELEIVRESEDETHQSYNGFILFTSTDEQLMLLEFAFFFHKSNVWPHFLNCYFEILDASIMDFRFESLAQLSYSFFSYWLQTNDNVLYTPAKISFQW